MVIFLYRNELFYFFVHLFLFFFFCSFIFVNKKMRNIVLCVALLFGVSACVSGFWFWDGNGFFLFRPYFDRWVPIFVLAVILFGLVTIRKGKGLLSGFQEWLTQKSSRFTNFCPNYYRMADLFGITGSLFWIAACVGPLESW